MIYNLNWKFRSNKEELSQLASEIACKMTSEDFYWNKIEEMLSMPETDQYLESLGIEKEGKSYTDLLEEISEKHFQQLIEMINEYFEDIFKQFADFMTDIFGNEIITYGLNEFEIDTVDYEGDKSSVNLDFVSEVTKDKIIQFIQKVFKDNCEAYDSSYLEDFYCEIDCPGIRYIPFKLYSQEVYNKISNYLFIDAEVKEVKERS